MGGGTDAAGRRAQSRAWYLKNRDRILSDKRAEYAADPKRAKTKSAKYRLANPERVVAWRAAGREKQRQQMAARRMRNYRIIDRAKAGGCVDCGERDLVVLDLDHVRGQKLMNVSKMFSAPLDRLIAEIAKCETRCSNCHRRATAHRRAETKQWVA